MKQNPTQNPYRELRNYFGLVQADLAMFLGLRVPQLAHAEAGRRDLPTPPLLKLLPLLRFLPPPYAGGSTGEPPVAEPETTPAALKPLTDRLRMCRLELAIVRYRLEQLQ